ncbi:hypothetical protein TBLA_0E01550 [Henningerozyma blattae CBS 6284]|uniref:Septin-type G domain-containing protein n=1 Tax=Henningerozyma blattae (strain ATCC 34711 / CBS 6284 / DSM 70876 / NBRC 10599 / NRRL Y-10934 / UCD 77-7) TaxID=1071380 RepID=I2H4B0_HENB6|nr:hypothetical protein TBLA_0E01550 [Tetrapisispora blattae CBS 6284]CCH61212.1 hypothetical protein TBLA_0E01550 [Tetrapisispora blattae CBS 6284]
MDNLSNSSGSTGNSANDRRHSSDHNSTTHTSPMDIDGAPAPIAAPARVVPPHQEVKIIHRDINTYVGFANLPKQWHRKSIRRGFNFNLLCVGQSGLGKSTLINTLFNKDIYDLHQSEIGEDDFVSNEEEEEDNDRVKIDTISTTIEENGVELNLTVIEAPGFGDFIDNTNSWEPIIDEINSRFDQYLDSENKIDRSNIIHEDNRIHACLYFIEPTGHNLKALDLKFMEMIHTKCNLIPIISKSDILDDNEIFEFKNVIKQQLLENNIEYFKPPTYAVDDSESIAMTEQLYDLIPYAIVGGEQGTRSRSYPWGIIEVDNPQHCDFVFLRDVLIKNFMEELREKTNTVLYENYRSNKLKSLGIKQDNSVFREYDPELKELEDKKLHEAKLAKLETEMKTVFQQKVSEKEKKLQKSESELFQRHKEMKDKLTKQLKALEEKKHQLEMSLANQVSNSPVQSKKKGFLR